MESSTTELSAKLETRYALLSDELDQAQRALAEQERRISLLEKQLHDLVVWIRDSQQSLVGEAGDEPPPPHY